MQIDEVPDPIFFFAESVPVLAPRPECRKFHLARYTRVFLFSLLASVAVADAQEPRGVMTDAAQKALSAEVRSQTVTLRRQVPAGKGIVVPGDPWRYGRGWHASAGRVITVASFVADWPLAAADRLEVIGPDGTVHEAAVGLLESALGLAVLDVDGLGPGPTRPPLLDDGAMYGGGTLFAAGDSGLLARYAVRGPAQGAFAYYWTLDGVGLPGTPLMSHQGRLVSLIGLTSPTEKGRSFALPVKSLRAVFERAREWQP